MAESTEALPPLCLLAGGRGVRLGHLTADTPKPMLEVHGRPFIEWCLMALRLGGFRRVVICTGYGAPALVEHLGHGSHLGLEISYSDDGPHPLGTLGAIRQALRSFSDIIPVTYADTVLSLNFQDVIATHMRDSRPLTMAVLRNHGLLDVSNTIVKGDEIVSYSKSPPPPGAQWIEYGFQVIDREAVLGAPFDDLADLTSDLVAAGQARAYVAEDPFIEIGTPDSLAAAGRKMKAWLQRSDGLLGR